MRKHVQCVIAVERIADIHVHVLNDVMHGVQPGSLQPSSAASANRRSHASDGVTSSTCVSFLLSVCDVAVNRAAGTTVGRRAHGVADRRSSTRAATRSGRADVDPTSESGRQPVAYVRLSAVSVFGYYVMCSSQFEWYSNKYRATKCKATKYRATKYRSTKYMRHTYKTK